MAATVEEVVKSLLGGVGNESEVLLAIQWVNERYQELVSRVRFNHLRKVGEFRTAARVTTGTITSTKGSKAITGDSTTWATSPGAFATTVQPYWAFRGASAWYEIDVVTNDTSLTLLTAYSEESLAAGSSYEVVKRYHPLASSARWLGQFIHPRLGVLLGEPIHPQELDTLDPQRNFSASSPTCVSYVGTTKPGNTDGEGILMVEVYPYTANAELIKYVYWDIPSVLTLTGSLPPQIDGYVLKEGAYIDYCRFMMAKREKEGKLESTTFWRNEMHAARTKWEYMITQATKSDRAVDDLTFVMQRDSGRGYGGAEIVTAHDHWLSKYTRP